MYLLRMVVASITMDIRQTKDAKEQKTLSMGVYPRDNRYLELKTGEFFLNPEGLYPLAEKPRQTVSAWMRVGETIGDDRLPNTMHYFKFPKGPLDDTEVPVISFECFLPSEQFRDLTTNIRNRFLALGRDSFV